MGSLASAAIPGISKNFGAFNPATQPQPQPQPQAQQPQSIPPQGVPGGMGNLGAIFQSLLPMIMNGGLFGAQQNQGQRALNAVNSGGVFSPGSTAIQPQYNRQMNSMQDATARLGNLSRFGQPSNTMPGNSNSQQPNMQLFPGSGPVQKHTGQAALDFARQNPGSNPNNVFNMPTSTTSATNSPRQPAAYNPYQMRTNSGTPAQTVQTSSQPARPATTAAPPYGQLNSKAGIANSWQNATNNGKNGSQAGSMLTTSLVNSMTPAERQKFFSTGQVQQPSNNPFAKRPLIV